MPLKGIGIFDAVKDLAREPCDLAIATSERTAEVMANSLQLDPATVLICGEPKTDPLPTDLPGWDFCASLRQRYSSLIGYFPTWRETIVPIEGSQRRRGDDAAQAALIGRLTADAGLRDVLERHRAALVVRMHAKHGYALNLSPPFFSMDDTQGDVTHLLQACDAAISDYSSVVIDALLFDLPLALWCEDLELYTRLRPLPYFDFRETFGWAIRDTLPELRAWIGERLASRAPSQAEQDGFAKTRALFHNYARGGAGDRLLAHLRSARR